MHDFIVRAKRLDNGEWVEGYLYKWINPLTQIPTFYILTQEEDISGITGEPTGWLKAEMCRYEVIPSTIGQYTGLKDKNGKKIFEGDIFCTLNGGMDGIPRMVRWNEEHMEFKCPLIKNHWAFGDNEVPFWLTNCENIEVIGNIHDNPELLR